MTSEWIVGVGINVLGAAMINLGTVLMKYHSQVRHNKGPWKKVGLTLFILGSVLTFVSFAYAAQSLLSGVSAIQFVTNLVFVHFLLGEPFTRYNMIGTLVLISGIGMIVVSSDKTRVGYDLNGVFQNYYFTLTHLYFVLILVFLITALSFAFWFRSGVAPFWWSSLAEQRLVLELSLPRSRSPIVKIGMPTLFVCLSAMIGAQSVVSGKVLSLVLSRGFSHHEWSEFKSSRVYIALMVWVITAAFWVVHLSRALRLFTGGFVIPLTQVCWTFWSIVSGGVVYREFTGVPAWQLAMFGLGAITLFGGVILLAPVYGKQNSAQSRNQASLSHDVLNAHQSRLHKLLSTMSVDEVATGGPQSPTFVGGGRSIVFAESVDIPDPPYIRWRRASQRPAGETSQAASTTDHAISRKESFSVIGNQRA